MIEPIEMLTIAKINNENTPEVLFSKCRNDPKNVKRKLKIPQILIKLKSKKISNDSMINVEEQIKTSKLKKELIEWSLLTKFDCYSKIFENELIWVKIVWSFLFLLF